MYLAVIIASSPREDLRTGDGGEPGGDQLAVFDQSTAERSA